MHEKKKTKIVVIVGSATPGCGSSGWQAPEQLLHGCQTRAVDLFSLGCVMYFCITGGTCLHLHDLGIVHQDLKPQNVLISRERSLCAKLSDMGIGKRLLADMSSLGHHAIGKYSV
ncbi:hypothetical protein QYF36_023159 [Acer negundo]|nr:hypothetical protein QYF36_015677 [Acer negundo]KAK4858866.1 hypothetical protein QYF36_023159 [Acer negundo]